MRELLPVMRRVCPRCYGGSLEIGTDDEKNIEIALCHNCCREFQVTITIGEEITQ